MCVWAYVSFLSSLFKIFLFPFFILEGNLNMRGRPCPPPSHRRVADVVASRLSATGWPRRRRRRRRRRKRSAYFYYYDYYYHCLQIEFVGFVKRLNRSCWIWHRSGGGERRVVEKEEELPSFNLIRLVASKFNCVNENQINRPLLIKADRLRNQPIDK